MEGKMSRKMKRQPVVMVALIAIALLSIGTQWVQAQDLKIDSRPLTPREIADYGLTNTTQIASGNAVVGLGQPVYLELLVEVGTVVTQAVWTLDAVVDSDNIPIPSSATIDESPLPTNMPTYDSVDRVAFDLVDRAVIFPDVKGTYRISAQALTSNDTLNASIEVVGSVFLGQGNTACTLCHASKQADFNATHHAEALKASINDPDGHFQEFCIKCHALGYDTAPGAVNGGFDDVAADLGWTFPETLGTNNWDEMPEALQMKSNVQCENCHGPAQEHLRSGGDISKIGISLSAGTCGQCHDAPSHHVKNFEWGTSLHGQTTVDRSGSCKNCHTTAGFIDANDPGMNEFGEIVPVTATFKEGITCAACHDPHAAGGQIHQLRDLQSVELGNGDVITEGGAGLVCMNCHKSRREAETYVLGNVSKYFGPHHGPQGDMIAGVNAAEYGQDMPSSKHLSVVEESCAQCHMQATPDGLPEYAAGKIGGHSFALSYDDGTNAPIHLTEACMSCHGEIEDFDFGGEDYNLNGIVEGVQSEIEGLLHEIAMLLPPIGSPDIDQDGLKSEFNTQALKSGLYNYLFVEEDGSLGVHNPKYAAALLSSSLAELKGGIDIDSDGLVDSWEIENFGDLTSQSGESDYDEDGLTNAQEENLGTDPMLIDTDGDGISDLLEIQNGSDPLDINDVASDLIMLPAVELAYLPQSTGTVVRFQGISSLSEGSWADVGQSQTNDGSWIYQFDTPRTNGSSHFYRAIEE
jgi:hypothetical protein